MITYPARKVANDFEAFRLIKEHLLSQCQRSEADSGCLYRGPRGYYDEGYVDFPFSEPDNDPTACAVGCLIDDRFYSESLEQRLVNDASIIRVLVLSHPEWDITNVSINMLTSLQTIHDRILIGFWKFILDETDWYIFGYKDYPEFLLGFNRAEWTVSTVDNFEELYKAALSDFVNNRKDKFPY